MAGIELWIFSMLG